MRAGEIRALAVQAGIAPGVSVLDLCCGVAGPGRFITRELGCSYLGVDSSADAVDIARSAPATSPVVSRSLGFRRSLRASSTWCSCSRRCSPSPTRSRFCGRSPRARRRRAVRVHAGGGRAADRVGAGAHARRRHRLADPARRDARAARPGRAGRPLAGRLQCVAPRHGGLADRRVHRRCNGHRGGDRAPRRWTSCWPPTGSGASGWRPGASARSRASPRSRRTASRYPTSGAAGAAVADRSTRRTTT